MRPPADRTGRAPPRGRCPTRAWMLVFCSNARPVREVSAPKRYVGEDRIGDANQVALALTTRLFDHVSGAQYLSATVGQIRYFSTPRVGLPVQVTAASSGQTLVTIPGVNPLALPGQALVNSRGQILMTIPGQYVSGLPSQT